MPKRSAAAQLNRVKLNFTNDHKSVAQSEGVAQEAQGAERDRIREIYFESFPGGRDRLSWPGITHFLVRPK